MNRERAKKLLPVIQAWAEGKTIQVKYAEGTDREWTDFTADPNGDGNPIFESDAWDWRVKPKIETRWVIRLATFEVFHKTFICREDAMHEAAKGHGYSKEEAENFVHEISWEE